MTKEIFNSISTLGCQLNEKFKNLYKIILYTFNSTEKKHVDNLTEFKNETKRAGINIFDSRVELFARILIAHKDVKLVVKGLDENWQENDINELAYIASKEIGGDIDQISLNVKQNDNGDYYVEVLRKKRKYCLGVVYNKVESETLISVEELNKLCLKNSYQVNLEG